MERCRDNGASKNVVRTLTAQNSAAETRSAQQVCARAPHAKLLRQWRVDTSKPALQ